MLSLKAEYFSWSNGKIAASGHRTCTQHARGLDDKSSDCSCKHLTEVPQDLYTDIQNLDLSYNNLTTLKNGSFKQYPHLLEIDLSSTNLLYIETGTFYLLKNLRNLILSNNYALRFYKDVFWRSHALLKLKLPECGLTSRYLEDINFPPGLEKLDLSSNEITFIDAKFCSRNIKLSIDLSKNKYK